MTAGGAAVDGWTVTWAFADGQTITQAWNTQITSSGPNITARNASYNGGLNAGAGTSFGFTGTWNGTNSAPSSVACTAG